MDGYPAYAARYLRRLLLNPPPFHIADQMRNLLRVLLTTASDGSTAVTLCPPISIGKVVSLLSAGQANAATFREIAVNIKAVATLLRSNSSLLPPLMAMTAYDSGISSSSEHLLMHLEKAHDIIKNNIALDDALSRHRDVPSRDSHMRVPDDFFYRNEIDFRGSIAVDSDPLMRQLYDDLGNRVKAFCDAVANDFPKTGIDVVFDVNNNLVCFQRVKRKRKATGIEDEKERPTVEYFHPLDRTFTPLARKYTSKAVDTALKAYLFACEKLKHAVQLKLIQLCTQMVDISPEGEEATSDAVSSSCISGIVQSAHLAVILNTALYHAYSSRQKGWVLPMMEPISMMTKIAPAEGLHLDIKGLTPYWLDRSSAARTDVDINGILLLTAPNMSGKSTLMRATLVAALLANCGFCIPAAEGSQVPRYDCFFMRTSSYDIPSEAKSAFGLEMDDMRVILRDSTPASIVMIDEIGKGTSSRDGAAIAGALLEYLDQRNVSGIFATHLHELMGLPLVTKRLHRRRMGMKFTTDSAQLSYPEWTYNLEEGVCTDSMAIVTARAFGLPFSLCHRAEELGDFFDGNVESSRALPRAAIKSKHKHESTDTVLRSVLDGFLTSESRYIDRGEGGLYDIMYVPHGSLSPAYLEGQSCLYVLEIESAPTDEGGRIIYVGESEVVAQRLHTHRRNLLNRQSPAEPGRRAAENVRRMNAFCVPVRSKSEARFLESNLISAYKRQGFDIRKDGDESHRKFGAV
mmetsp:Transcript_27158/g.45868  ORF Transcript_27158/g.45868 Transcript_27158/m.45868 type:complete len:745 (-) Transcript_27158:31-2265(-)